MTKITDLASQTAPAGSDLIESVDVSDTSMAGTGTNKKLTLDDLDAFLTGPFPVAHLGPPSSTGLPSSSAWFTSWHFPFQGTTSTTSVAEMFHLMPIFFPRACTIQRARASCTTLESGATLRIGLYASDERLSLGGLVADYGTVDGSTTGEKLITSLSTAVTPGWYWYATWASNHATVRWTRTNVTTQGPWTPTMNLGLGRQVWGRAVGSVDYSAGLPSSPTTAWTENVSFGNPPIVWFEAST